MKKFSFLLYFVFFAGICFLLNSCEEENPCAEINCLNGGTCVEGICNCPEGFSSINCEVEDLCTTRNIACENGGICLEGTCNCPDGFAGVSCETVNDQIVQKLLKEGSVPIDLYKRGIPLKNLYGKIYKEGLIFYLDTTNGYGLVSSAVDQSMQWSWGCSGRDMRALNNVESSPPVFGQETEEGVRIGDGKSNTNIILSMCDEESAAKLCRNLGVDWFLPSRAELNLIYVNLHLNGFGNFPSTTGYWSSSEFGPLGAWYQSFSMGSQNIDSKKNSRYRSVRAVRNF